MCRFHFFPIFLVFVKWKQSYLAFIIIKYIKATLQWILHNCIIILWCVLLCFLICCSRTLFLRHYEDATQRPRSWTKRLSVMEDEMYGMPSTAEYSEKALMTPENIFPAEYQGFLMSSASRIPMFGSDELLSAAVAITAGTRTEPYPSGAIAPEIQRHHDTSSLIKAKIASHPHYPRLLQAYIDCQKVVKLLFNSSPYFSLVYLFVTILFLLLWFGRCWNW